MCERAEERVDEFWIRWRVELGLLVLGMLEVRFGWPRDIWWACIRWVSRELQDQNVWAGCPVN